MAFREEHQDRDNYGRPTRSPEPYPEERRKRQRSTSPPYDYHPPPPAGMASQHPLPQPPPQSHRGGGGFPRFRMPATRQRVPAPESVLYLVTRRHFDSYLEDAFPTVFEDKPRLNEAWMRYRSDFLRKYFAEYTREHGQEPWFQERYDPTFEDLRKRLRLKGAEGKVDAWLQTLAKGLLQELSYDVGGKDVGLAPSSGEAGDAASSSSTDHHPKKSVEKARSVEHALPVPTSEYQLVIKSVSVEISRETLEKHCAQAPGFDYLSFLDPNPQKRYHRVAFVNFKPGSNMDRAEELLFESKINNFVLHMNRATQPNLQRIKQFPDVFSETDRIRHDLTAVKALVARFEKEIDDERASAAIVSAVEQWELEGLLSSDDIAKKSLDFYLHLLRNCFHTCYYCGISCEFTEELSRKCIRHERRLLAKEESRRDARHSESDLVRLTDEKIKLLTDPASVNARNYGGEDYEQELSEACRDHVKLEEANKFRCKTCQKLFKASNFVEKHILNKHSDLLDTGALNRVQMLNNYVLDPNHIMPNFPQPPDPTGRSSMPPPMSAAPAGIYPPPVQYGMPFPLHMYPQIMGQIPPVMPSSSPTHGPQRLHDRIAPAAAQPPPPKRAKRDSLPAAPEGVRQDPRAQKTATSYNDLDSSVPTGEGELDY